MTRAGITVAIGWTAVSLAFSLALLRPILSQTSLLPHQIRRAYFEPHQGATALFFDEDTGGNVSDIRIDGRDALEIPAGRTIAIALERGTEIIVRTHAADLAPYVVVGSELPVEVSTGPAPGGTMDGAQHGTREPGPWDPSPPWGGPTNLAVTRLSGAAILDPEQGVLGPQPWQASRSWDEDKGWLRSLHAQCAVGTPAEALIRMDPEAISIRIGSCQGSVKVLPDSSSTALLVVVTGPFAAVAYKTGSGWLQTQQVRWWLVAVAFAWIILLSFAIGPGATALASGVLFSAGEFSRPEAILAWVALLPIAVAGVAGGIVRLLLHRPGAAWAAAGAVLALEIGGVVATVAFTDVRTFGMQRITRHGDSFCSMVGYSTVRGDGLRYDSAGVVERLNEDCARCRGRTARFSREAQTLRWVHQMICTPSFPVPHEGEIVFLGGANDDMFYQPTGLLPMLGQIVGMLRFFVQPIAAGDWEPLLDRASQNVEGTLEDQAADIAAIVRCADEGGRRFRFLHDFLIWDLDRGRPPPRQRTLERRRAAVFAAGGEFVDLFEEFRGTAGVSWFNDFIHPSAVGQQMIAELLCTRLASYTGGTMRPSQ